MGIMRRAEFWSADRDGNVRCELCPHYCVIEGDSAGVCGVRGNRGGELFAASYGQISSIALDPIEKKPLALFRPGRLVLSIGSFGCNFSCPFCQNFEISKEYRRRRHTAQVFTPGDIVMLAERKTPDGNIGVAYTYNEPLIGYEFVRDTARLVREAGLNNVVVTNGYINKEPLDALLPFIDAMNIDLKAYSTGFYRKIGGDLDTVKQTIVRAHGVCHVEVTMLVIPGENEDYTADMVKWLSGIDPDIPLHLSRFFPRYRYADREPTDLRSLNRLGEMAMDCLRHVFIGNV